MSNNQKLALYASYQIGEDLPGYVRFALKHLAETDFHVILLTNERKLSQDTYEFLADYEIELFLTKNHGYDFGMWKRYLQLQSNSSASLIDRLLVLNDSIVYYQNKFEDYIKKAEESSADVISLTNNNEIEPHLQSYFLYMKPPALGAFYMHLFETPEQETFYGVVQKFEIALSEKFVEGNVRMEAIFPSDGNALFEAKKLIQNNVGFIKRKLLQRRFNIAEKKHFIRMGALDALNEDYAALIKPVLNRDFKEEWIPQLEESRLRHSMDLLWEKTYHKLGWPFLRNAIKLKYKILHKPLIGDEFK